MAPMSVPKTRECPLDSRTRQISTLIFCQNFCDHVNKRSPKNTMNEMQMKSAPPSASGAPGDALLAGLFLSLLAS